MNLVKCDKCKGTKKVNAMGGLIKECPQCKGEGVWEPLSIIKQNLNSDEKEVSKQRGRPRKESNCTNKEPESA